MSLDNVDKKRIAEDLDITERTVSKWQERFKEKGIDGLNDAPRSGRPPDFDVKDRCEVIAIACDSPKNYGHNTHDTWTVNLLTETVNKEIPGLNMGRSSVGRTLLENELRPQRFRPWLHSKDPNFKEKVSEVIDLYIEPPDNEAVLCVDEKPMQANEHKNELVMPQSGKAGKEEYEYIRHGTQALIAGFDIKTGEVSANCQDTRKADDILLFMDNLASKYESFEKIHIVWDNLNIHHEGKDMRWTKFNEKHGNKFVFHYTPLHASWINQIEIFFSILHRRVLKHGSFKSKEELREKVLNYIIKWNKDEKHPFNWTFRGYPMQSEKMEVK